jgi:hypothetical protein
MKTRKEQIIKVLLLIIGILILPLLKLHAEDLRSINRLTGYWKFSIGDQQEWAMPGFDDSDGMRSEWRNPGKDRGMMATMVMPGTESNLNFQARLVADNCIL